MKTETLARWRLASGRTIAEGVRASLETLSRQVSSSARRADLAGAAMVLYRLVGSAFADSALDVTAGRAWSYVRQALEPAKCRECRCDRGIRLVDGGIARLGSTALALLALTARIDRAPCAGAAGDDVRLLIQIARYLTSRQEEDGSFVADPDITTGERVPSSSPHDVGMAVLALCAAHRIAGQAEHGEAAALGARHLVEARPGAGDDGWAAPNPWLMKALAELHGGASAVGWVDPLRAMSAPLVAAPAWLYTQTRAEVAACLAGLFATFTVERRLGERARAAALLRVILAGLERCHESQSDEGIEAVQHTLAVSFGLLQVIGRAGAPAALSAEDPPSRKRRSIDRRSVAADEPARKLVAHRVVGEPLFSIVPGDGGRDWMDGTTNRFANRCLPLRIANQAGWVCSLPEPFAVEWNGRNELDQVTVFASERIRHIVGSHFGYGIVTFQTQFLFRTEPGYNLLVRGPANAPKDGISPLEGIVETDWTAATFTMNWQITRPHHRVGFAAGEPIGMIVPVRRGELETFVPELHRLNDDPQLAPRYITWRNGRRDFERALEDGEESAIRAGWQRDYMLGRDPRGGTFAPQHQTKLILRSFRKTW